MALHKEEDMEKVEKNMSEENGNGHIKIGKGTFIC